MNDKTGEVGANKIASIAPKRTREKLAIAEFLILTSATKEIDGRQYSRNEFWEALAKTTVEMKETRGDVNQNGNGKERNVGIDKFAADIYNTVSGADDEESEGRTNVQTDNTHDVELPSGFYGNVGDEDGENELNQPRVDGESNVNAADRNEVEIQTGSTGNKTVRVRRAAINVLCFKDVIAEGTRKIEKKELPTRRYRELLRQRRRRKMEDDIYNENEDGVEDEETKLEMVKLKKRNIN